MPQLMNLLRHLHRWLEMKIESKETIFWRLAFELLQHFFTDVIHKITGHNQ